MQLFASFPLDFSIGLIISVAGNFFQVGTFFTWISFPCETEHQTEHSFPVLFKNAFRDQSFLISCDIYDYFVSYISYLVIEFTVPGVGDFKIISLIR